MAADPGSEEAGPLPVPAAGVQEQVLLNVYYASQTGNGEGIAEELVSSAGQAGLTVKAQSLNDLRPAALKKLEHVAFVISTHGEGDPPDDALELFDYQPVHLTDLMHL